MECARISSLPGSPTISVFSWLPDAGTSSFHQNCLLSASSATSSLKCNLISRPPPPPLSASFPSPRLPYPIVFACIPAESTGSKADVPARSVSVILLAGGTGKRMGAKMPKQYLPLLGQPVALHSFCTFASMEEVKEMVVVCDPSYRDIFEDWGRASE